MERELAEDRESLWWLTASPAMWAAHFLASYLTAAVYCAKVAGRDGDLGPVRVAIGVFTAAALLGIGLTARRGWRRHGYGAATIPHDFDTPEDRHRFLGFATLLLSLLSGVAVIYQALVAIYFERCT